MAHELPPFTQGQDDMQLIAFECEAHAILFGLLTFRGMSAEIAVAVVGLWEKGCMEIWWNLDADGLGIKVTTEGIKELAKHDMIAMPSRTIN